jgi:fumarylacetoacetate (FAA) hydrolase
MKLASLPNATRDGELVVVSRDLTRAASARAIAPNLLDAMERWSEVEAPLRALHAELEEGRAQSFAFDQAKALSPLPRSFQWIDGSCFKSHLRLMDLATGRPVEPAQTSLYPLMYQGMSDAFFSPQGDYALPREEDDVDFEGEVAVVIDETPMGVSAEEAKQHVRLVMLCNDVSCRAFVKREISVGFGWMHAKTSTAFSPVATTPDELGDAWDGRVRLPLHVWRDGKLFGKPNAGQMSFSFYDLIAHAAHTRKLAAGTIIGSGTVSNADYKEVGSACIAERRSIETIEQGKPSTGYLKFGERVRMEMFDSAGRSIFGAIDQKLARYAKGGA